MEKSAAPVGTLGTTENVAPVLVRVEVTVNPLLDGKVRTSESLSSSGVKVSSRLWTLPENPVSAAVELATATCCRGNKTVV